MLKRFSHQDRCLEISDEYTHWLFACDTGTGKTRIGLDIIERHLVEGRKALVIAPLPIIKAAWLDDAAKFVPNLKVINGKHVNKAKRHKMWAGNYDVLILNYETAWRDWKIISEVVDPQILIMDESVKVKDYPRTSKVAKNLSKLCTSGVSRVYLLSGCPAPNHPLEYYTQMRMVENPAFDKWSSRYAFRNDFFYKPKTDLAWLWEPQYPDTEERIMDLVKERAIFIKKEECLDLPDQTYVTRMVELGKDEKQAYKDMKNDFILQLQNSDGNTVVAQNILSQIMKLRQITSGFVAADDNWQEVGSTKLKALQEVFDEIGNNQVLIFGQFRAELERLSGHFGERAALLYGGMSEEQREEVVTGFISGKYQYLFANPATAKYGFTFTNATYCVWVSQSYNYDEWYQGNQRIHRHGQNKATTHISLLAEGTIDEVIYSAVNEKQDINQALLTMLKE